MRLAGRLLVLRAGRATGRGARELREILSRHRIGDPWERWYPGRR